MPKALVLGATGHIGAHLVRALLAEGHPVRAGYRNERFLTVLEGLPVERFQVDLENLEQPQELSRALEGCEWVFHAAGYYPLPGESRAQALAKGVETTRQVLEALRQARPARIVFTSSAATIRWVAGRSANESDEESWPPVGWRSTYSMVKIAMEKLVLRAAQEGLPVVTVNPSLCIGEYDAHLLSARAVLAFLKYRTPRIPNASFNVVYTGDVGLGHVRAAQKGRVGERYLLAGQNISLKEFAALVAREAGVPPPRWHIPYALALASGFLVQSFARITRREPLFTLEEVRRIRRGYLLDGSKARRELALPVTPVEEAIRRALAWFHRMGYTTATIRSRASG